MNDLTRIGLGAGEHRLICAVVLAAGRSRRMGRQKLLLPLGKKPIIAHVVDTLQRSVARVFVVVGPDGDDIISALAGRSITRVVNPDPDAGMLGSVRCGLRALPHDCAGVLVALGDQPRLTPTTVEQLVRAYARHRAGIVVPTFEGRRGHPLLFAADYRQAVLRHYDTVGLRGLLLDHPEAVQELEITDSGVLEDLDTPDDYRRITGQ